MPTRMKDIAAYLGISSSTVSRALNNTGYVSEELRRKISQAIVELDYQPNLLARGLRKKSTNLVGLIVPDLMNPYYTSVAQAIEGLLAAREYRLILSVSNEDPASELSYLQALQNQRVAGVIIASTSKNNEYLTHLVQQGVPVVAHTREVRSRLVDNVLAADSEGGYAVARHLIELGHTRVGVICGPQELSSGRDRLQGFLQAFKEADIPIDTRLIRIGVFQRAFGARAALELLDLVPPPTALFAAGGELTAGMMKALFERRVTVPGEISVVGYDDPEWFSFWHPPITTVDLPVDKISKETVEILIKRMTAQKMVRSRAITIRVPINFIARASTTRIKQHVGV